MLEHLQAPHASSTLLALRLQLPPRHRAILLLVRHLCVTRGAPIAEQRNSTTTHNSVIMCLQKESTGAAHTRTYLHLSLQLSNSAFKLRQPPRPLCKHQPNPQTRQQTATKLHPSKNMHIAWVPCQHLWHARAAPLLPLPASLHARWPP